MMKQKMQYSFLGIITSKLIMEVCIADNFMKENQRKYSFGNKQHLNYANLEDP